MNMSMDSYTDDRQKLGPIEGTSAGLTPAHSNHSLTRILLSPPIRCDPRLVVGIILVVHCTEVAHLYLFTLDPIIYREQSQLIELGSLL